MECIYEVKNENLTDKDSVDLFTKDVLALTEDSKFDTVILDMNRVLAVGSFCIGTIIGAYKAMNQRSGELILRNVSERIRKTMEMLKLVDILHIE